MAENREAYRRGGQLGWQLPLLCGTVAFVVYLLTLSPGIYPGQSAQWMALCLGIDPRVVPAQPPTPRSNRAMAPMAATAVRAARVVMDETVAPVAVPSFLARSALISSRAR